MVLSDWEESREEKLTSVKEKTDKPKGDFLVVLSIWQENLNLFACQAANTYMLMQEKREIQESFRGSELDFWEMEDWFAFLSFLLFLLLLTPGEYVCVCASIFKFFPSPSFLSAIIIS